MADWFQPLIVKQESAPPDWGFLTYQFPLAITGFDVSHTIDQKLVKRPRVDAQSVHGTSKGLIQISITGEFQNLSPSQVAEELNDMWAAACGVATQNNEVRIFSHYNAVGASSVCVWYERCKAVSLNYDNFSRRQYRTHLWPPWKIDFIALDPVIYTEGTWEGSEPPPSASPTAPDPNNIVGSVTIKGCLYVKNATSGLTTFKVDQDGDVQVVGAITNPRSIT